MAVLDVDRNVVVVRIVYDGPPRSGKTTSVNALAASLGRNVYCPEQRNGRTSYFDWVDYTGGRFEGREIRCQILSVPGQDALDDRRRTIMNDADAIVFVADTSPPGLADSLARLGRLRGFIAGELASPPVGVIVQANKRDLGGDESLEQVREAVSQSGLDAAVTESVAADGTGVRETFVFAVRLALDRVRALSEADELPSCAPAIDAGPALYAAMAPGAGEQDSQTPERPQPPDPLVPSGAVWPPVAGRVVLHEASRDGLSTHRQLEDGDWVAGLGGGWRIHSARDAELDDFDAGRARLVQWARLHLTCEPFLSARRCIALCPSRPGHWRLWQVVRAVPPVRERLEDLDRLGTTAAAARLLEVAEALVQMQALTAAVPWLSCTLDTVGVSPAGPVFVGLMPQTTETEHRQPMDVVDEQLSAIITATSPRRRAALRDCLMLSRPGVVGRDVMGAATASLRRLLRI